MLGVLSLKAAVLPHVSLPLPVFLGSGFVFLRGAGGLWHRVSLVPEVVQPRLFRDETLRAGAGAELSPRGASLLIAAAAAPAAGLAAPGMVCGEATERGGQHSGPAPSPPTTLAGRHCPHGPPRHWWG